MVATLRGMGRDIGDIDAWLTSWDYPTLAGTLFRTLLEEMRRRVSKLLRITEAIGVRRPPARPDDPLAENPGAAARPRRTPCR